MTTELDHYMQAVSRLREENAALRAERDALVDVLKRYMGTAFSGDEMQLSIVSMGGSQGIRSAAPELHERCDQVTALYNEVRALLANPQTAASVARRRAERAALADLLALFDYQQDRYPSEWNISVNFPEVVLRARAALAEPGQK